MFLIPLEESSTNVGQLRTNKKHFQKKTIHIYLNKLNHNLFSIEG